MNIKNKDLNLLLLFKVLYEELNVSAAATRLNLSQPALSHKLNKLRHEFADPLFVRAARGLTATPKAISLSAEILQLVSSLEGFYQHQSGADFLNQPDRLVIYSTDYIESVLVPDLLALLAEQAPRVQLVMRHTQGVLPKQQLERGDCDLAIAGFYRDLPESFYQQKLQTEDFVVLMRRQHPLAEQQLDLEQYCQARHLVTTLTGDLDGLVDQELAKSALQRHVCAGVSGFLSPAHIVHSNDVLLTCLKSLADNAVQANSNLVIKACPVSLPQVQISQIWHSRTQDDPLRRWLRQHIHQLLHNPA
ncbi:LysR family transcriptional regulator [Rheinheimera soli]|uniref:DNA-binding transcriptional LysR family regulator n=1 Tax=Rheinheimera soli TaxID=443616 RepID=A0ABU1VTS2_9GAMM|nr:LysR family transcriptional regulator [Rheinheimera soli]MDR7119126.1 DNA-binding transcriptional LysR family regulator [Rheinheimera soli]